MPMKAMIAAVVIASCSAVAAPALAHHSAAAFDRSKLLTLNGTIKEFRFANPHSWIYLEVTSEQGQAELWSLEGGSISILSRNGWTSHSLNVGDRVTVTAHPRKDENLSGAFEAVTLSDGTTLGFNPLY
jgi:hypothetical protein